MINNTRKRTHLSSEKVSILEESFNENILPDSTMRSRLAQQLSVPERTVQIWFQNRRAKEKKNKMVEKESSSPRYEPTFRSMITPEIYEQPKATFKRPRSISKPEQVAVPSLHQRALSEGEKFAATDIHSPLLSSLGLSSCPIQIIPLQPSLLRIGSWTRFGSEQQTVEWDLFCYVNFSERAFVWKIRAGKHQFKIELGFDQIQYIQLQITGQLDICTHLPLSFGMLRFGQDKDWVPCGDFTENQQASIIPIHTLQGHFDSLKSALLDIVALAPELSSKVIGNEKEYTLSPSPEPLMMYEQQQTRATTAPQIPTYSPSFTQIPLMYTTTPGNPFSFF
ncbi:unnamed protein product [Rhizopus stolonifer]